MKLSEYLKSLGNTPQEVADNLEKQGIKGIKQSPCQCPIINAIYTACPDYWSGLKIINGHQRSDGHYGYYADLDDPQIMDPSLPQPVMDFIGRFDAGEFPNLEAKTVRKVVTTVFTYR